MTLQMWWTSSGALIRKLIALVASFASIMGLLVAFLPPFKELPWWAVALLFMAAVFFLILVLLEFFDAGGHHVYSKEDADGIRRYMHGWIEHGGRVAIWTRDMSWAENQETCKLLTQKARRNELILCLPEMNPLATQLMNAGAEVCAYGVSLLESPASRFTIVFLGRDGSRVAVGRAEGNSHVIDEFSASDHPAFHIAADLVSIVRSLNGRHKQ